MVWYAAFGIWILAKCHISYLIPVYFIFKFNRLNRECDMAGSLTVIFWWNGVYELNMYLIGSILNLTLCFAVVKVTHFFEWFGYYSFYN